MDNCRDTDNSVGTGTGQQLHDGRVHSYPAGNCYCCCAAQPHSGAARVTGGKGYLSAQVDNRKERNKNRHLGSHHTHRYMDHNLCLSRLHLYNKRAGHRSRPSPDDDRVDENISATADRESCYACKRHRVAGHGKEKWRMSHKTFQQRGGCHDGKTKGLRRKT